MTTSTVTDAVKTTNPAMTIGINIEYMLLVCSRRRRGQQIAVVDEDQPAVVECDRPPTRGRPVAAELAGRHDCGPEVFDDGSCC
jgi:hypothetical protein